MKGSRKVTNIKYMVQVNQRKDSNGSTHKDSRFGFWVDSGIDTRPPSQTTNTTEAFLTNGGLAKATGSDDL